MIGSAIKANADNARPAVLYLLTLFMLKIKSNVGKIADEQKPNPDDFGAISMADFAPHRIDPEPIQ